MPLYRRNELTESQVLAINEIAGVLDTGALADMRRKVADGADPGAVAGHGWTNTRWARQLSFPASARVCTRHAVDQ